MGLWIFFSSFCWNADSRFTQQELPACKPIVTPGLVITTFTIIGIIFIPMGLVSLSASEHVVEIVDRYDEVPKLMKSPVFIYYQLDNFYQNHRRYVKSRSDKQLRNKAAENETNICDPEGRSEASGRGPIVPCGLIAWTLFHDTYGFSVKEKKIQLSEQEDLIVWMRTAALPNFRKLYGRIEEDLQPNEEITVVIQNNYNTYSFGGRKELVLSTTSWIGGKNDFLGIAYITVGGLCLFFAVTFILLYVIKPRPLGDPSYLSWNKSPSGHPN
ncbi:hypothetical protein CCACVL1_03281 [Corchorus capsularis]|uniref:ALA-interacting subunit n=1 Tax=Corchorus capsularis TaxID=210143 RepID=A0A1R3K187_COCAP|nr:hypothetical protein CCACVL1_03281 [Corchorus capsularis]